jgi:nitrogen fixation protein FixH
MKDQIPQPQKDKAENKAEKKSKIPYIFFAFFAVIFAVNFFYIYLSKKTWRGVATENAYQKGLNYNQTLKQVEKQKELGWNLKINYYPNKKNSGLLSIRLTDKNSHVIKGAEIFVDLKRPTQEGFDFVKKAEFVDGSYQTQITFPLSGQWDFEITAKKDGEIFKASKRYVIQ